MEIKKPSFYEILLFIAYGFYILLGLLLTLGFLYWGKYFNPWSFSLVLIFGSQAYFRHRLTNLILGIFMLGISVFLSAQFFSMISSKDGLIFGNFLIGLSLTSVVLSIIMIFGYLKLSFIDR